MSSGIDTRLDDQEIVEQVAPHIYKVCPPASELRAPAQKDVPCPVIDCGKICKQPSALRFHLERVHKIFRKKHKWELDTEKPTVEWHCPEPQCVYSMTQKRYFSSRTLLKQHYGKLHLEKTLCCDECGKMFGLEKDLKRHMSNNCTMVYMCTCGSIYMHRESYMMHCSREKHPVKEEYKVKRETQSDLKEKKVIQQKISTSLGEGKSADKKLSESTNKSKNNSLKTKTKSDNTLKHHGQFKPILPSPNVLVLVNVIGEKPGNSTTNLASGMLPSQLIYIADARSSNVGNVVDKNTVKSAKVSHASQTKSSSVTQNARVVNEKVAGFGQLDSGDGVLSELEAETRKQNKCYVSGHVGEGRSLKKRTVKSSTCTQTSLTRHKRIAAQTQTTGDLILRKAMQSADIPTKRESRASQVSPQAKVKKSLASHMVQSAETQTASRMHQRHRPKRAGSRSVSMGTNTPLNIVNNLQGEIPSVPNPWPASNMETQTSTLLSEFQSRFPGASAATQTLESFLLNDVVSSASNSQEVLSQHTMSAGFNTLVDTMDQAVLCDLGLVSNFSQSSDVVRTSTCSQSESSYCSALSGSSEARVDYELSSKGKGHTTVNNTVQSLADVDFSENQPDVMYGDILRSDAGVSTLIPSNITESNTTERQNFEGADLNLAQYRGLDSCTEGATSRSEQIFSHNTLLADSNVHLGVEEDAMAQTDISDLNFPELLTSGVQTSDFDAGYMNIETQTVDDSMIDQLLNSMETQTNDDFFAEFGFSNIETQTQLSLMTVDDPSSLIDMGTEVQETQPLASSTHQVAGPSVGIQTGFTNTQATMPLMLDIPDNLATDSVGIQTQTTGNMPQETDSFSVGIQTQQNLDLLTDTETQTLHTNMELCPDLSDSYTQTAFDDLVSFVDTLSNI